jgi:hypothetical protein
MKLRLFHNFQFLLYVCATRIDFSGPNSDHQAQGTAFMEHSQISIRISFNGKTFKELPTV